MLSYLRNMDSDITLLATILTIISIIGSWANNLRKGMGTKGLESVFGKYYKSKNTFFNIYVFFMQIGLAIVCTFICMLVYTILGLVKVTNIETVVIMMVVSIMSSIIASVILCKHKKFEKNMPGWSRGKKYIYAFMVIINSYLTINCFIKPFISITLCTWLNLILWIGTIVVEIIELLIFDTHYVEYLHSSAIIFTEQGLPINCLDVRKIFIWWGVVRIEQDGKVYRIKKSSVYRVDFYGEEISTFGEKTEDLRFKALDNLIWEFKRKTIIPIRIRLRRIQRAVRKLLK